MITTGSRPLESYRARSPATTRRIASAASAPTLSRTGPTSVRRAPPGRSPACIRGAAPGRAPSARRSGGDRLRLVSRAPAPGAGAGAPAPAIPVRRPGHRPPAPRARWRRRRRAGGPAPRPPPREAAPRSRGPLIAEASAPPRRLPPPRSIRGSDDGPRGHTGPPILLQGRHSRSRSMIVDRGVVRHESELPDRGTEQRHDRGLHRGREVHDAGIAGHGATDPLEQRRASPRGRSAPRRLPHAAARSRPAAIPTSDSAFPPRITTPSPFAVRSSVSATQ